MTNVDPVQLELRIRSMSWKARVKSLLGTVEELHQPEELPDPICRWFDWNRAEQPPADAEVQAVMEALSAEGASWFHRRTETMPISGWVVSVARYLRDGVRWWLLFAERHDDAAPLIGPTVPAPASVADLKRLSKIVAYAGGNPKRHLLRTGPLTEHERNELLAAGKSADEARFGIVFFAWKA